MADLDKIISLEKLSRYHTNVNDLIDSKVNKLITDTELRFFCVEPVTVVVNGENKIYQANTLVDMFLNSTDEFEVIPTSNTSILSLYAWPGALNTFYDWLNGVNLFDGVLFDMNDEAMYTHWSQGQQGQYRVQYAQYKNCIFWSDNSYISDVNKRTNYVLYYTSELPLCYSTIPDNTFKSFYFAYNVTVDPNWSNPRYKESFAKATWATQVFSYYGLHSIGIFDMDSSEWNITLPKDCRGLMFYAPNILNAGVFDAVNVTNFGAKSGSWRDAFAYCYQLQNLYIKNLKVNLNVSWSPINQQSLEFILNEATNTSKITISLSPYTYYRLTESNKTLASQKNITLELITTNTVDDIRLNMLKMNGDGNMFLADNGTYKSSKDILITDGDLTEEEKQTARDNIGAVNSFEHYSNVGGQLTETQYDIMSKYMMTPFIISIDGTTTIPDDLLNETQDNFVCDWYWQMMRVVGGEPIITSQWVDNKPYKLKSMMNGYEYTVDYLSKTITRTGSKVDELLILKAYWFDASGTYTKTQLESLLSVSIDTIVSYAKAGKSILIHSSSDTNANNSQLIEYNYTLTDEGELNTMALRWYQYEYLCYMYIVLGSSGSYTVTLTKTTVD